MFPPLSSGSTVELLLAVTRDGPFAEWPDRVAGLVAEYDRLAGAALRAVRLPTAEATAATAARAAHARGWGVDFLRFLQARSQSG